MPCYSIVTNTINLANVKSHDRLEAALKDEFKQVTRLADGRMVFTVDGTSVTLKDGALTSRLDATRLQEIVVRVQQAYGREIVKFSAKRFGWVVEWDKQNRNAYQLRKNV
jgi:hypothetical protein